MGINIQTDWDFLKQSNEFIFPLCSDSFLCSNFIWNLCFPTIRWAVTHIFVRVGGHQKNASLWVICTWNKGIPMWHNTSEEERLRCDQPARGLQDNGSVCSSYSASGENTFLCFCVHGSWARVNRAKPHQYLQQYASNYDGTNNCYMINICFG